MRRIRIPAILLALPLLGWATAARAQQFTFDTPALSGQTSLSFSLAETKEDVGVDGLPNASRSSRRRQGAGTLAVRDFVAGVRSRSYESDLETRTLRLKQDASADGGFVGWNFHDVLFSKEDVLTVLAARDTVHAKTVRIDTENFVDAVEKSDVGISVQLALVYRLPWLLVAYSRANATLDYELTNNLAMTTVDDTFPFDFQVMSLGLRFFEGILQFDFERQDNPPVKGETLQLDSSPHTFQAATLDVGFASVTASETSTELNLRDFFTMERDEQAVALTFDLRDNLSVTFKKTRTTQTETVSYTATPVDFKSDAVSNEVSFTFRVML